MKVEINEIPQPEVFKPYVLSITIETLEEERVAAELYNHFNQVSQLLDKYQPTGVTTKHINSKATYSRVENFLRSAFKDIYHKVY